MKKEKSLSVIGKCPVCGKGNVVKTSYGYCCDEKKGKDCSVFSISQRVHGVTMTDDLVRELLEKGRTQEMEMTNINGQPFHACFVLSDGKLDVEMKSHFLHGKCPVCGGRVLRTSKGYACENHVSGNPSCDFHVTGIIHGRKIAEEEMEDLLAGKAQVLDGFTTLDGKAFSSVLTVREDGKVGLEPRITKCPACGGNILVSPVAYNCSNYKTPGINCQFSVWRNMDGHVVTNEEMHQICEEGQTKQPVELFKMNGAVFYKRLALSNNKQKVIKV